MCNIILQRRLFILPVAEEIVKSKSTGGMVRFIEKCLVISYVSYDYKFYLTNMRVRLLFR